VLHSTGMVGWWWWNAVHIYTWAICWYALHIQTL